MMKRVYFIVVVVVALMLGGCRTARVPAFGTSPWTLEGNTVSNAATGVSIDFGGGDNFFQLTNMSDGDYDLHFITGNEQFAAYDTQCRRYIESALRMIPLQIDSVDLVLADSYIVFTPAVINRWLPDLVREADGTEYVVEAHPRESDIQPHGEIWRNFIYDNKLHRILVVDRIIKNGRHLGIVYIVQGETARVPMAATFHYDVTSRRNVQVVGEHLRWLFDITIAAATQ